MLGHTLAYVKRGYTQGKVKEKEICKANYEKENIRSSLLKKSVGIPFARCPFQI